MNMGQLSFFSKALTPSPPPTFHTLQYEDILGPQNVERRQLVGLIDKLVAGASCSTAPSPDSSPTKRAEATGDPRTVGTCSSTSSPSISATIPAVTHVFSSSTVVFGKAAAASPDDLAPDDGVPGATGRGSEMCEMDDQFGDLNKASDAELAVAKAKMDVEFEKKRLKPGDHGFEWDLRVDFDAGDESNEWDEESD